jgi:hypothetical protein
MAAQGKGMQPDLTSPGMHPPAEAGEAVCAIDHAQARKDAAPQKPTMNGQSAFLSQRPYKCWTAAAIQDPFLNPAHNSKFISSGIPIMPSGDEVITVFPRRGIAPRPPPGSRIQRGLPFPGGFTFPHTPSSARQNQKSRGCHPETGRDPLSNNYLYPMPMKLMEGQWMGASE